MSHPLAPSKSGLSPGASPWPWAGRLLLLVLAGNMLIDGLEVSVVVAALPSIGAEQGLSAWQVQWAMGGFALGFGALLLPGRHLALRLGHRRLYLGALALFVLASVAGGLTTDPLLLLGSRIVKGMCAALTAPTGLAIISTTYEEGPARARALSVYTFCGGIGFTTGLLLSGALTPHDWRWTFVATAPVAAVLLVLAAGAVPRGQPRQRSARRSGPAPRELLGNGALLRPALGAAVLNGTYLGLLSLVAHQTWSLLHWSAWQTAAACLPACLPLAVAALSAGRMVARFGAARLVVLGAALHLLGLALYARLDMPRSYTTDLLPTLALVGIGFVPAFAALNTQAGQAVDAAGRGTAIAAYQTAVQAGAVVVPGAVAALLTFGPRAGPAAAHRPAVLLLCALAALGLLVALRGLTARRPGGADVR
ncbi:MFS transporter [Streptomyces kanamyceticus]|uniref:MFS transporter n=1 Tax=Streptomyces kanamyceticus TaxID=1967 RepID=UPI0037DD4109